MNIGFKWKAVLIIFPTVLIMRIVEQMLVHDLHAKNKKTDYVMKDSGTNYAKLYRRKNETANADGDF